jgi:ABC-type uncharacterized transport system substrate-binding protein
MRRRDFIKSIGSAAVMWPLAAHAQQPAMPVIGFLDTRSVETTREQVAAFKRGLAETGYVEGRNVAIEYRWADNQTDRLPALASDLVRQRVTAIVAPGPPSALAAKAATTTIPIVFTAGEDPVRLGLVASLARPGGNLTGINWFGTELTAKRLELLRELVPAAARVVLLVQPSNVNITELTVTNVETAARAIGVKIQVLNADTSREKQIAPSVTRVAILKDPTNPAGSAEFAAIQTAAQSFRMEVIPLDSRRDADEMERAVAAVALCLGVAHEAAPAALRLGAPTLVLRLKNFRSPRSTA